MERSKVKANSHQRSEINPRIYYLQATGSFSKMNIDIHMVWFGATGGGIPLVVVMVLVMRW